LAVIEDQCSVPNSLIFQLVSTHITLALPESKQQEGDRAKQADPHHPLVTLNPIFVRLREEADSTQPSREKQLDSKDGVDFANELHANRKGCFCD